MQLTVQHKFDFPYPEIKGREKRRLMTDHRHVKVDIEGWQKSSPRRRRGLFFAVLVFLTFPAHCM